MPVFSLFEAMSALELMDPKMDESLILLCHLASQKPAAQSKPSPGRCP